MLIFVLAAAVVGDYVPKGPKFSWDTMPVFFHSSNASGPYTQAAINFIAKFPMATIEKFQGPCGHAQNATPACHQEKLIIAELARIKAVNPNVSTVFYYNSVLDFPQYELHAKMLADPSLMVHDKDGNIVYMTGGGHKTDVFDFGKPEMQALFIQECVNATKTGFVDGCFVDRSVDGIPDMSKLTNASATAYLAGHIKVHQDLQKAIGEGPVIANHAYGPPHDGLTAGSVNFCMIEGFGANNGSIQQLMLAASNGRGVQAHSTRGDINAIAAFLVGAGYRAYFGYGGWDDEDPTHHWLPEFEYPVGEPLGPATYDAETLTYMRRFQHINVSFDLKTKTGTVQGWPKQPTPPPTPPPSPPPPINPTKTCPKVVAQCGYEHFDLKHFEGVSTWQGCCSDCSATEGCERWVYHDDIKECRLHGASAQMSKGTAAMICGEATNTTIPSTL